MVEIFADSSFRIVYSNYKLSAHDRGEDGKKFSKSHDIRKPPW